MCKQRPTRHASFIKIHFFFPYWFHGLHLNIRSVADDGPQPPSATCAINSQHNGSDQAPSRHFVTLAFAYKFAYDIVMHNIDVESTWDRRGYFLVRISLLPAELCLNSKTLSLGSLKILIKVFFFLSNWYTQVMCGFLLNFDRAEEGRLGHNVVRRNADRSQVSWENNNMVKERLLPVFFTSAKTNNELTCPTAAPSFPFPFKGHQLIL